MNTLALTAVLWLLSMSPVAMPKVLHVRGANNQVIDWPIIPVHGRFICGDPATNPANSTGCTLCHEHKVLLDVDLTTFWQAINLRHETMHVVTACDESKTNMHQAIQDLGVKLEWIDQDNPDYVRFTSQKAIGPLAPFIPRVQSRP